MAALALDIQCNIDRDKLEILVSNLNTFLPYATIPNLAHLQGIHVIPDNAAENFINRLLQKGKRLGTYTAGTQSNARAIPLEMADALYCHIVLNESLVQQITPHNPSAAEIVIPLFEELLHVRHYSTLWQQQGYLYPEFDNLCSFDLFKLCFSFYDEYIVNRWKWTILTTQFHLDNGEATPHPSEFPLIPGLTQAQNSIFNVIREAVAHNITKEEAWRRILLATYRNIFELLARYAAPVAVFDPGKSASLIDLSQHQFYQQYVASYWKQVRTELERAYDCNLTETREALSNMVQVLRKFLENLGVTYLKTARGDYQIDFVVK